MIVRLPQIVDAACLEALELAGPRRQAGCLLVAALHSYLATAEGQRTLNRLRVELPPKKRRNTISSRTKKQVSEVPTPAEKTVTGKPPVFLNLIDCA